MSVCWFSGLGILMCHLARSVSSFLLFCYHDFGVIDTFDKVASIIDSLKRDRDGLDSLITKQADTIGLKNKEIERLNKKLSKGPKKVIESRGSEGKSSDENRKEQRKKRK